MIDFLRECPFRVLVVVRLLSMAAGELSSSFEC